MNKKDTSYRMPEGFNPYLAADAARGLVDAVHWFQIEGPGAEEVVELGDKLASDALVDLLKDKVHELHAYIHELANSTSLHLPMNEAELDALRYKGKPTGVREEPPLYAVR